MILSRSRRHDCSDKQHILSVLILTDLVILRAYADFIVMGSWDGTGLSKGGP